MIYEFVDAAGNVIDVVKASSEEEAAYVKMSNAGIGIRRVTTPQYTVMMMYPDYMSEDYPEIFIEHTEALSARDAVAAVRESVYEAKHVEMDDSDDLKLVAVFEGRLCDLSDGRGGVED